MKETSEFQKIQVAGLLQTTLKLANGLLAIGTIHYLVYLAAQLIRWIF
jgi:preprotein translocase subunit Sss1